MKLWIIGFVLLLFSFCFADEVNQSVSANKVEDNVDSVIKVYDWEDSLDALKEKAEKNNKMIFWMHIVGTLDGGL